jgi:hypothetical protein
VTLRFAGQPPRLTVTNADGLFLFAGLLQGTYQLETSLEGFSTVTYPATVAAGQIRSLEVRLNPGVEDRITVLSESAAREERRLGMVTKRKDAPAAPPAVYYDFDAFEEMAKSLRQGLVGGVKPLPIAIPETGKLLLMTGVLPPEKIAVALEVKGKK